MKDNFLVSIMMNSKIFDGFSKAECEDINQKFQIGLRHYAKGELVLNEGETVNDIYIIHRGKLVGMKFYYEGDTHLLRTFGPGEVIAIEAVSSTLKTSPLTFIADEQSEIMFLPISITEDQLEKRLTEKLLRNMLHVLADENIKLLYKTEVLSKRALRNRIVTFLAIIQEKRGSNSFRILMNQEQFAQYLCVNRSALSYELNQMKKEGLIHFEKDLYEILKK